ncbi:hypothetical protein JCM8202_005574 [Rhodotorula sphaerocarpa]
MAGQRPQESAYMTSSWGEQPRLATLDLSDSEQYLRRIGLDAGLATLPPSLDLLDKLSVAHHLAVPFDTSALHVPLEAWAKEEGDLALRQGPGVQLGRANFERIVERRHGGFCYAQNPLFASLLRGFGFRVSEVAARVFMNRGKDPKVAGYRWNFNTHVALIVDWEGCDGRYVCDVGFGGGGPPHPIPLENGATAPSISTSEAFMLREETMPVDNRRFTPDPPSGWTLYRRVVPPGVSIPDHRQAETVPNSFWTPCFHFSLATMAIEDTMMGNLFNCTNDAAAFVHIFVVSRLLPNGGRQSLCRGIPAMDAEAPDDDRPYAKLYTKDSVNGEEYDIDWIPFDVQSIGQVLKETFGFKL